MACIVAAIACTLVAVASHAETEFYRVLPGSDFAVMNPQTATVTGQIRLISRVGEARKPAVPFTLPANSQQKFPDLLATTFSTANANIVAVESSDIVRTNATKLRLATPSRTIECSFRAAGGADPIVLVGLLSGSVNVTVVDRATGVSKTAGPLLRRYERIDGCHFHREPVRRHVCPRWIRPHHDDQWHGRRHIDLRAGANACGAASGNG